MKWSNGFAILVYFVAFAAASLALTVWFHKSSKRRKPFPENLKLLRMPGEHLWAQIWKSDENDALAFLLASVVPLSAGLLVIFAVKPFIQSAPVLALILIVAVFILSFWGSARVLAKRFLRRGDYYLGFFGERYVADCLEPLKFKGWSIFHDVPFDGATGKFNIDHVAVGPNGIWVIETKSVRKRRESEPKVKEWEVSWDGAKLKWPWGDDRHGIDQAMNNARSLRAWFQEQTGRDIPVCCVVTFPGWSVVERKLADIRVANPKKLGEVLTGRKQEPVSADDLDLYRRLLGDRCRNVTY